MKKSTIIIIHLIEWAVTAITAVAIGLFTYFVIYERLAEGHRLTAYLYNIAFIAVILIFDKIADYLMEKDIRPIFARLLFVTHFISFKTALYLFYIVMLVVSRISILEPDMIDRHQTSFIYSVEYGVVLLIPLDKFVELLTKDDKRIFKIITKRKKK